MLKICKNNTIICYFLSNRITLFVFLSDKNSQKPKTSTSRLLNVSDTARFIRLYNVCEILSARKECIVLQGCLSRSPKILIFKFKALESLLAGGDAPSCESANRLWKKFNLSSVLFSKASRFDPEGEWVSEFAVQQHH